MKRQLNYRLCSVIAALAFSGAAPLSEAAAAGIATVTAVENQGYRRPPGHEELFARRADELVQNEALRTADESAIHLRFVDGSELSVEALSEVVLSDYVFDGNASAGLINLNDGVFRFQSNGKPDQGVKLRTPVATIGIRGTEILVHVSGDDATIVDILEGAIEAQPHGRGKPVICVQGQSLLVSGPDSDAICGDIGSFSTAAGPSGGGEGRGGGSQRDKDRPTNRPEPPERPAPDPDPDPGEGGEGEGGSGGQVLFIGEELNWAHG